MNLGALEKTMKNKTTTLKFWLGRKKTITMEFWKKTRKKKTTNLGALEKTMKKKIEPMGILEKIRTIRRRANPCFFTILVSYPRIINMRGESQRFV